MTTDLPIIALSTADPAGIGPEICLKAAMDEDVRQMCRPVVFGDPMVLNTHIESGQLPCTIAQSDSVAEIDWSSDAVPVLGRDQFGNGPFQMGEMNAENGTAAWDTGAAAIKAALKGDVSAVVAAPNTKTSINLAGIHYEGYASQISAELGIPPEDIFMMLSFGRTNIAHCTLHVSLRRALELITQPRVEAVVRAVHGHLVATGKQDPLIVVAGVNPHASEGGLMGDEEGDIIIPALDSVRAEGVRIDGPEPADLMLHREDADAFIMMIHDQGHVPAKLLARHGSAGIILGTPIRFSSVGHGSALDIAGQGKASPDAIIEAIRLISGQSVA